MLFLSLFSCNFGAQMSPNCHRFVILCMCLIHRVRIPVFDNYQKFTLPLMTNKIPPWQIHCKAWNPQNSLPLKHISQFMYTHHWKGIDYLFNIEHQTHHWKSIHYLFNIEKPFIYPFNIEHVSITYSAKYWCSSSRLSSLMTVQMNST